MSENKTEQAKQLIVRYMRDQKMKRGDRLPGQVFFREKFGYGTTTIARAIRELRDDGVLDVRDKIGVFVVDAEANGHIGRTVAVTAVHLENNIFYSVLSTLLQLHLVRSGNLMRLFCCQPPSRKGIFSIDEYPGLRRCVEDGEIQGIVHLDDFENETETYLREKHIPALKIGSIFTGGGIFIDTQTLMHQALDRIYSAGVRCPGIILNTYLRNYLGSEFRSRAVSLWPNTPLFPIFSGYNAADGIAIMREYMALPQKHRPDGLIIMDDILGGSASAELAKVLSPSEMPLAVIMRNIQLAIPFPFRRSCYYDIDLDELTALAAGMINRAMQTGILEYAAFSYLPRQHLNETVF